MTPLEITFLIISCVLIIALIFCLVLLFIKTGKNYQNNQNNEVLQRNLDVLNEKINKTLSDISDKNAGFGKDIVGLLEVNKSSISQIKSDSLHQISESFINLNGRLEKIVNTFNTKVESNLEKGFKDNNDSLEKVNQALGAIKESQRNLDNLSNQVTALNNVLTNSQRRGQFGEIILEDLLKLEFGNVKDLYYFQHQLENKKKPDAVIKFPNDDKYLCIDAKFSFIAYSKIFESTDEREISELKKSLKTALNYQIKKIAEDYVDCSDTQNYAVMFIPSEGVFSYIYNDEELYKSVIEFGKQKHVIIASPSTLQAILYNVNAFRINYEIHKNTKEVLIILNKLKEDIRIFMDHYDTICNSIKTASSRIEKASASKERIEKRFIDIDEISEEHFKGKENE